ARWGRAIRRGRNSRDSFLAPDLGRSETQLAMKERTQNGGRRGGRPAAAFRDGNSNRKQRITQPMPTATPMDLPDPARSVSEQEPRLLLAMCIFGEARGESDLALRAVAQVVLNR